MASLSRNSCEAIALRLLEYCQSQNWAGWDPYDALNSRLFQTCKFLNFKYARLALTQLLKRSPVNFRPLLLVPKEQNPKGIALFLSSAVKLTEAGLLKDDRIIRELTEKLLNLASPHEGYIGWGYNFDWQTRGVLVVQGTPNIICTTFAGNALLDAYPHLKDSRLLDAAANAAKFILEQLYDEINESEACFNYYLQGKARVHNANFLGAGFLCRVSQATGNQSLIGPALKATRFSANRQHADGSWDYGEAPSQRWIDNFHTGFNLCALRRIGTDVGLDEFEPHVMRGFEFYRKHFFSRDGAPKYYHNSLYPIDIHCASQSLITLVELADLNEGNMELARKVLCWTVSCMWDRRGCFYYQKHPRWTNRISYLRWSQAWMLLAMATLEKGNRKLAKRLTCIGDTAGRAFELAVKESGKIL